MDFYIFARFHVREGEETSAEAAMAEVLPPTREEPGCLSANGFRSKRDSRLFYIHSRWRDEAAFDLHATLPHTVRFLKKMAAISDQSREVTRAEMIA